MKGRRVWSDGALVPWQAATVSSFAHAIQRGSSVFDVLSFHRTPRGVALFRLADHVGRFLHSAALIGLEVRHDARALHEATCAAVIESGLDDGLVRMTAMFSSMEGDVVPSDGRATVVIGAYDKSELPRRPPPARMRVQVADDVRKAGPEVFPPDAKVAASYLGPMLARRRALSDGFDEVVLLDREGFVAEAPVSNVFAVIDGALITPPLGLILPGITRDSTLTVARDEGLDVREEPLTREAFRRADEAFLTSTSLPIAKIAEVDRVVLGDGDEGPITRRLRERLVSIERGHDDRYARWLTTVPNRT